MKVTFLLPCYAWVPSGGFKVVYEYANRLVRRGHQVSVIHPRNLAYPPPPQKSSLRLNVRLVRLWLKERLGVPRIRWHNIDPNVELLFVASSDPRCIPDADVIFATAWHTVASVLHCPPQKGEKCYLIQHYETWMGPKELIDATWRSPSHKIVVSKWLLELGEELGATDLTYIPNGLEHNKYRLVRPIEERPRQVVMMCSPVGFKACQDGIKALEIAKRRFPDLRVVLFANCRRPAWVPQWMRYWQDPPQEWIVEELYNNSSIVLSSSIAEGFSLPPAEGAACGCAIVATDSGGIRDFVENGVTGLLSPPKDTEALAANLCLLLGNDDQRIRLAKAANQHIELFRWEHSTDLLENLLFRVLKAEVIEPNVQTIPPAESEPTPLSEGVQGANSLRSEASLSPNAVRVPNDPSSVASKALTRDGHDIASPQVAGLKLPESRVTDVVTQPRPALEMRGIGSPYNR